MPKAALAEWNRLVKELVEKGLLTVGDRVTFETYCRIVADVEKLEAMKNKVGIGNAIKLGFTGQLIKMRGQLKQYAAELGLTPSSRSGVKAAKTKAPTDAVKTRFFGGGAGG